MNERFKELENLAVFYNKEDDTWEFDREKFAELIVRECIGIVAESVEHREPASTYVGKIKSHFGVEE